MFNSFLDRDENGYFVCSECGCGGLMSITTITNKLTGIEKRLCPNCADKYFKEQGSSYNEYMLMMENVSLKMRLMGGFGF